MATRKSTLLPRWILRVVGYSSLAVAVVGIALYWYKRYPPRRRIDGNERANNNEIREDNLPPTSTQAEEGATWSNKILGGLKTARKNKKKMTISLKNTALWNPSSDVDTPNHAFRENAAALLTQLSYIYDIYIIVHVNSEEERESIKVLLENAGLFTSNQELDNRKVIFCQEEEGKIHIIRHIEPFIHIEGGWEKDDGEDIVKKLRPFVHKIVWVITKRRRDSFKPGRISEADKSILGHNVEVSELLLTSSIAREALGK